ncbi:MAG: tig [Firmicutes bacterium]|nr:tig [Bacillota bacterium]
MNVKVDKIEANVYKLEITVEAAQFSEAMNKSYKKNMNKFNVPGFRKGKAPMSIIKKFYGVEVLFDDAIDIVCDETYPVALAENEIKPVDYPGIEIVQIGEGKDFIYTATVTVKPEVELGEYKGVEVKKPVYEVSDAEIDAELISMQEKNARVTAKEEGTVENGNITVIDFKGFVDGIAFEGGTGSNYELEIGSGTFIDNFEEQLIGAAKGETRNVSVTFPEDYGKEDLNGKPAVFEVTVHEIKAKELPALDDEFAKEVSEFDTIEEMKADLKSKMEEYNKTRVEKEYESAVIDAVVDNAKVEIPEAMISREIDNMLKDLEMRLQYQGLDLKTYYEYTNTTEEKAREFMREAAEKRVKSDLVIEAVAKVENVEATEEELSAKANELAKHYGGKDVEKTVKMIMDGQRDYLETDVVNEKVVKLLVDSSKPTA